MIIKQQFKGFVAGIIITCMLFTMAFAAPVSKTVSVVLNTLSMQISGKAVKVDTITYNNTLYAPVKSISEALGKDFTWDTKTNAVTIKDKVAVKPTTKPATPATPATPAKPATTTTTTKPTTTTTKPTTTTTKPATTTTTTTTTTKPATTTTTTTKPDTTSAATK